MAKEDLGEVAEKVYKTFSGLPKEEQRRVAYRLNWMVKKLFLKGKEKLKKRGNDKVKQNKNPK